MTRARIEKLEALLARVERRRAEPRLVPVGVQDVATANTNLAASTPSVATQTLPSPRPRAPERAAVSFESPSATFRAPEGPASTAHLSLDHPSRRASSLPPPPVATADTLPRHPATPLPPRASSEPPARAPTELLPAAPERIAPQPAASSEGVVQAVSAPRIDAPRSFGDLLALSLSLRPR